MDFASLLSWIVDWGTMGYLILFLMTLGESLVFTGLFVPGTLVLVIMGGLASTRTSFDVGLLAMAAVTGAIIGNAVSYELGRIGRVHVERWARFHAPLAKARAFFLQHHGKSVFLGRFVGPIRPFIPFVAGAFQMGRASFYAYNVASAVLWCAWFLVVGYAFGRAWQQAFVWSTAGVAVMIALAILVLAATWLLRRKRRRARQEAVSSD